MCATRRLVVITGLGASAAGSLESVVAGLRPAGWDAVRRPSRGSAIRDDLVVGPGGLFCVLVRDGRPRAEWARDATAKAGLLGRLTGHDPSPLLVLTRAPGWKEARRFHGVDAVPLQALARDLVGRGNVLSAGRLDELRAGLRLALAA
jgi:hypothetical protein